MATVTATTNACPRLSSGAPRITTAELLALLDPPARKRNGTIRALVLRHIPKRQAADDFGLSHVIA